MARFSTSNPGRPFVKRSVATDIIPAGVNPGQWLTVNGRHARLGHNNRVVFPNGKSRKNATVSNAAFLMACNRSPVAVLSDLPVQGETQLDRVMAVVALAM